MLERLVEEASRRAGEIRRKVSEIERMAESVSKVWVSYSPRPQGAVMAGVDSGWNYIRYRGFYLYAISVAYSVLGDGATYSRHPSVEVDVIAPGDKSGVWSISSELWLRGSRMELRAALEAAKRSELVLMDGSLLAKLVDATHWGERDGRFLSFRDELEEASIRLSDRVVFVSKDTESRLLLEGGLGDLHYLELFTKGPGFTRPVHKMVSKTRVARRLEWVTVSYARLEEGSPVIRLDLPGSASEKTIERLLDLMHTVSVDGYPYPLILAHEEARVSHRDIESVASILGLEAWPRSREVVLI